ncbi:ATP-dependent RNA helicase mtr4 [Aduncisulcus paluster]|uniref:ATP-dependent RNA helicase mtr4 n=1 Tax=Aduncisulcus paluster TaxID=2918883 RepID=A0ABQ5KW78_9EUKA|nr:ATP-dependent RNA helicase mtr4 [Aduncisulcus paluster]
MNLALSDFGLDDVVPESSKKKEFTDDELHLSSGKRRVNPDAIPIAEQTKEHKSKHTDIFTDDVDIIEIKKSLPTIVDEIPLAKCYQADDPRKAIVHQLAFPPRHPPPDTEDPIYNPPMPENPVREYPFKLDPFQRLATSCIAQNQSVLVSAHTSAGKRRVNPDAIPIAEQTKEHKSKHTDIFTDDVDIIEIKKSLPTIVDEIPLAKCYQADDPRKAIVHQLAFPPRHPPPDTEDPIYNPPMPENPVREYPFKLDPFQRLATSCIAQNQSVLVSAHTSAGKTVVAEYAIAEALKKSQRVIYTSPIKALSNQKYRDLSAAFPGKVGLMTGDDVINEDSSCIVMTTEILRSMLYRDAEVTREVGWVIFDEVHYLADKSRGFVWEETIIALRDRVRFVFLSATIPNASEFAGWVSCVHHLPVHVVYTEFRPVPLEHYIIPEGSSFAYLCVDDKSQFRSDSFNKAIQEVTKMHGGGRKRRKGGLPCSPDALRKLLKLLKAKSFLPVICFAFGKKSVEQLAVQIKDMTLTSTSEQKTIRSIFDAAVQQLPKDDRSLPFVQDVGSMLVRGVGIHHSGLLPTMKEIVEIMFQQGLVKILFATETFAMGLNLPARTVIFSQMSKFDGETTRLLLPGEYIQMAGRAGRRGQDEKGTVMVLLSESLDSDDLKGMVKGSSHPLESSFKLSWTMVLTLKRREDGSPAEVINNSFAVYHQRHSLPQLVGSLGEAKEALAQSEKSMTVADIQDLETWLKVCESERHRSEMIRHFVTSPARSKRFIRIGRVVQFVGRIGHVPNEETRVHNKEQREKSMRIQKGLNKGQSPQDKGSKSDITSMKDSEIDIFQEEMFTAIIVSKRDNSNRRGTKKRAKASDIELMLYVPELDEEMVLLQEMDTLHSKTAVTVGAGSKKMKKKGSKSAIENVRIALDACRTVPGTNGIVNTTLHAVSSFSPVFVDVPGTHPESLAARKKLYAHMEAAKQKLSGDFHWIDPAKDMGLSDNEEYMTHVRKLKLLEESREECKFSSRSSTDQRHRLSLYQTIAEARQKLDDVQTQVHHGTASTFLEELSGMWSIARRLGYVRHGTDGVLSEKGRFACLVSAADEILLTEASFDKTFAELDGPSLAAVLSCLVDERQVNNDPELDSEDAMSAIEALKEKAEQLAVLSEEQGLDDRADVYRKTVCPRASKIVKRWCEGANFEEIMELAEEYGIFEGEVVRLGRRLNELLRQLCDASVSVGATDMGEVFKKAMESVKRGIMFTESLYHLVEDE